MPEGLPKRHRRHQAVFLVVGAAVVIAAVLGALAWSSYRSISDAKSHLEHARAAVVGVTSNPKSLVTAAGRANAARALATAGADAAAAHHDLAGSFGLSALGVLPVLATQRNGMLQLAADVETVAESGRTLLDKLNALLSASSGTKVALPQLRALGRAVRKAYPVFRSLDRSSSGLLGPIASARRRFDAEDAKVVSLLRKGRDGLDYARVFLGGEGPRTYLVAGENNAEMRDQGATLSLATMRTSHGTFAVLATSSADNVPLRAPASIAIPRGTRHAFGPFHPTLTWQSTNATADFPWTGADMQAMWDKATGQRVDGVIALDVPALASLLTLTGPVTVPGISQPVTAANAETLLLDQLYQAFPTDQAQRHDEISAVAKAVADRMKTQHVDLAKLAKTLVDDVAERHVLLWDANPKYEAAIERFGASGAIDTQSPDRTFHLAVESAVAAKVDYFVRVSQRVVVNLRRNGDAQVLTYVTIADTAPAGQPPSNQLGPDYINTHRPGEYAALIELWQPRGSLTEPGVLESGLRLDDAFAVVEPQGKQSVEFSSIIPHAVKNGRLDLRFVPQPRLQPIGLQVTLHAPSNWHVSGAHTHSQPLAKTLVVTWLVDGSPA